MLLRDMEASEAWWRIGTSGCLLKGQQDTADTSLNLEFTVMLWHAVTYETICHQKEWNLTPYFLTDVKAT